MYIKKKKKQKKKKKLALCQKNTKGPFEYNLFCWNWKHCSKIIFKYVNSAVGPIFNEKVAEKWSL